MKHRSALRTPGGPPPIARLIGAVIVLVVMVVLGIPLTTGGGSGGGGAGVSPSGAGSAAPAPAALPESSVRSATGEGSIPPVASAVGSGEGLGALQALIAERASGEMVTVTAEVFRVLSDDTVGARHQRFLIAVGREGRRTRTVKVSHNIELAPRVPLDEGETVVIRGQFEWNDLGGVIHWTHHDPDGRRAGGWIEHAGRRYE